MSLNISGHEDTEDAFELGVRERDAGCVVSRMAKKDADFNDWVYFQAAHIVPLERQGYWEEMGFADYITDMDDTTGHSKIDSVQNGLLLRKDVLTAFENYLFSVTVSYFQYFSGALH